MHRNISKDVAPMVRPRSCAPAAPGCRTAAAGPAAGCRRRAEQSGLSLRRSWPPACATAPALEPTDRSATVTEACDCGGRRDVLLAVRSLALRMCDSAKGCLHQYLHTQAAIQLSTSHICSEQAPHMSVTLAPQGKLVRPCSFTRYPFPNTIKSVGC